MKSRWFLASAAALSSVLALVQLVACGDPPASLMEGGLLEGSSTTETGAQDGTLDSNPGMDAGPRNDPSDPDRYDTFTAPDPKWDTAPATLTSNGVEIIDPFGALMGKTVTIVPGDPSTFDPPVLDQLTGWTLSPSGPLSSIVFVRFPLPSARTADELLLLNTYWAQEGLDPDPEGDDEWGTHAVARVMKDGMHAIVAMRHFSLASLSSYPLELQLFASGTSCANVDSGVGDGAPPMAVMPFARGAAQGVETPAAIAFTHDLGTCALSNVVPDGGFSAGTIYVKSTEPGSPNHGSENSWAHPDMGTKLATLASLVQGSACGKLTVSINEMFDSDREHKGKSTHFAGRGVDLSPRIKSSGVKFYPGLGTLAALAYLDAKFDFVLFEPGGTKNLDLNGNPVDAGAEYHVNDHVHASVSPGMMGTNPEDKLSGCHDHGVSGLVRSIGGNGSNGAGGTGGSVTFLANHAWPIKKTNNPDYVLDAGTSDTLAGTDLMVGMKQPGKVVIHGTLNLTQASSTITSDRWVWVAPDGVITCDGCNLKIDARAEVRIDGLIDLSAKGAGKAGGSLTVIQGKDTGPVLLVPAIDVRGGDGAFAVGGTGGLVTIDSSATDSDIIFGTDMMNPPVPGGWIASAHAHAAQEYNSTTTTYPPFLTGAIVTSGGVGGYSNAMNMPGSNGGAGGDVNITGGASGALLGRVVFLNGATIVTGGTWKSTISAPAPVEYFTYTDATYQIGPDAIGVGSLGGQGYQGFGANLGSSGGTGGKAGALSITAPGLLCPSFKAGTLYKSIVGNNHPNGIIVGSVLGETQMGVGTTCNAHWATAGGSGGEQGGSKNFPGNPGAAGAATVPTISP